jgi:hypothetical protein
VDKQQEIFNEFWFAVWFALSGCDKYPEDGSAPEMPLWHNDDNNLMIWHQPPMYLPDYERRWRWVRLTPYNGVLWRLSNKRKALTPEESLENYLHQLPAPKWAFELIFHASELENVATDSLVRFVSSSFDQPHRTRAYQWPLFCRHRTFPQLAWTEGAEKARAGAPAKRRCRDD